MILGFKKQFVPLILSGEKIHTIRADKHKRWKPERKIQFATGVRTKEYNQFREGLCKGIEKICIVNHGNHIHVRVWDEKSPECFIHNDCIDFDENKKHDWHLLKRIVENDGLTIDEFIKWFVPQQQDVFEGRIIHWTNLRYCAIKNNHSVTNHSVKDDLFAAVPDSRK